MTDPSFDPLIAAAESGDPTRIEAEREALKASMRVYREGLREQEASGETNARSRRHALSAVSDAIAYSKVATLTPANLRVIAEWFVAWVLTDRNTTLEERSRLRTFLLKAGMETHHPLLGRAVLDIARANRARERAEDRES